MCMCPASNANSSCPTLWMQVGLLLNELLVSSSSSLLSFLLLVHEDLDLRPKHCYWSMDYPSWTWSPLLLVSILKEPFSYHLPKRRKHRNIFLGEYTSQEHYLIWLSDHEPVVIVSHPAPVGKLHHHRRADILEATVYL